MMPENMLRRGTPEEAGMRPDRIDHVKRLAGDWVAGGITPSLVLLAARKGIVFLHEAFGVLGPDPDSPPLQADTIFPVSSNTKPITAAAAMILVEGGLLGLNRPLVDCIPEICGEGTEEILVHHLLTHTSGYRDAMLWEWARKRDRASLVLPPCDETQHPLIHELLHIYHAGPLWKPPGEMMSYCDHNYLLLGEIIRRVSGRSLADFASERILGPLGMVDSHYAVPDSQGSRVVKFPPEAPAAQRVSRFNEGVDSRQAQETPYGGSGAFATAMDMATFGQMLLNGGTYGSARILSRPTVTEMTRNQIPGIRAAIQDNEYPEASWGFGISVQGNGKWKYFNGSLQSQESLLHGGAGGTGFWVDPVYEIVGVYFSVVTEATPSGGESKWNFDLFQNLVTAAMAD